MRPEKIVPVSFRFLEVDPGGCRQRVWISRANDWYSRKKLTGGTW